MENASRSAQLEINKQYKYGSREHYVVFSLSHQATKGNQSKAIECGKSLGQFISKANLVHRNKGNKSVF